VIGQKQFSIALRFGRCGVSVERLSQDKAGNLYGTTLVGGVNDLGRFNQLSPPATEGGTWTETVIFSFSGSDGTLPFGRLQFDQNGLLYGTTSGGGDLQAGTVFQLTPPAEPGTSWIESVLYSFSGGRDGGSPVAELSSTTRAAFWNGVNGRQRRTGLWRSDLQADSATKPGDPWTETVLHSFGGPDWFRSCPGLVRENGHLRHHVGGRLDGPSPSLCLRLGCCGYGSCGNLFSETVALTKTRRPPLARAGCKYEPHEHSPSLPNASL
jgi:uncharacterized repeat protein (TIGR03803 family)